MRRVVLVCAVGLLAAWGLGWLFLMDDDDAVPREADAVVVLAGHEESLPAGQALVAGGVAPTLVVSTDRNRPDPNAQRLCRKPPDNVVCVVRGPIARGGELQLVARVVRDRRWDRIVVYAPSYVNRRLERVFDRCTDARVDQVDQEEPWWRDAIGIPVEWVNLAVAETVRRGC